MGWLTLLGGMLFSAAVTAVLMLWRRNSEIKDREKARSEGLSEVQEIAGVGSWVLTFEPPRLEWSDEACRLFGFEPGAVDPNQHAWLEMIRPEDREKSHMLLQGMEGTASATTDLHIHLPDGSERILHEVMREESAADGSIKRVGTLQDVTEIRLAEERYRRIFDGAQDMILVVDPDSNRILDMNPAANRLLGYSRDEMLRMEAEALVASASSPVLTQALDWLGESGHAVFELVLCRKDGSELPVEVNSTLFEFVGSRVIHAFARDISIRKSFEKRLGMFSSAIEQAGEAVLIMSKSGMVEYANPMFEKLSGYPKDLIVGKSGEILMMSPEFGRVYRRMWLRITGGHIRDTELIDRDRDGTWYSAPASVTPIYDEDGNLTHYVAIQRDLSSKLLLEEQLRQSQKMEAIGTLVGGIAHDFNNMLAGILGSAFLAKKNIDDQTKVTRKLETIEKLGKRAADIIGQMLTFARKGNLAFRNIELKSTIETPLELAKSWLPENVEFSVKLNVDGMVVYADATMIEQALLNLLNNASDAVKKKRAPKIEVVAGPCKNVKALREKFPELHGKNYVSILVRDNGAGIKRNIQGKVFEPFFTTKDIGAGTGLGLSMVYGAVHSHGGVIWVDSRPNAGATFHMVLPLVDVPVADAPEENANPSVVEGRGETILFADDDEEALATHAEVLREIGYNVITAVNGVEAVKLFEQSCESISLVILDVVMPRLGGADTARRIRSVRSGVPVIFITGYDRELALADGEAYENCHVLEKPFSMEVLSTVAGKMIRRQPVSSAL